MTLLLCTLFQIATFAFKHLPFSERASAQMERHSKKLKNDTFSILPKARSTLVTKILHLPPQNMGHIGGKNCGVVQVTLAQRPHTGIEMAKTSSKKFFRQKYFLRLKLDNMC